MRRELPRRLEDEFDLLVRGDVASRRRLRPWVTSSYLRVDDVQVAVVQAVVAAEILVERLGPRREHDGLAALVFRHVLVVTHPVPELLGDERQERMEQAQRVREDEVNDRERVGAAFLVVGADVRRRLLGAVAPGDGEDGLAGLDIPVAILAPEEAVEGLRGFVEAVFGEGGGDFADGLVELEQDPLVVDWSGGRARFRLATSPPCIWRKRQAFQSLLQKLRPSSTSFSSNSTSWPSGALRMVPKRRASAPYLAMSSSGSGELPRLLLILRPSLSRMMPVK